MIGIRTDANIIIATGHMMRCITIAKQIVSRGESVTFFIADEESERLLGKNISDSDHMNTVVLNTAWDDMESELPVLIEQLQVRNVDILLVDSYKVTYDYFKAIDRVCKTAYIDDVHEGLYPVDMLINYNGYSNLFDYASDYKDMHGRTDRPTELLLGLMYAPLREQFHKTEKAEEQVKTDSFDVLFASGGADTQDLIMPIISAARDGGLCGRQDDGTEINWHVVVGDYVENGDEVEGYCRMTDGLFAHRSVSDMASLMRSCDLGVVAAGTMLTECAAVSLPAVFYQLADNQRYGTEYWSAPGRMIYAGDVTEDKDEVIHSIFRELRRLISDRNRLSDIRDSIGKITDGKGAVRIAERLCDLR